MNSSEKGIQGGKPSFSAQYRADCEKILPDPEFMKRLENTLATASHPDNHQIDLSTLSFRFAKRKRRTKWIAAACFIILLGAAGIFAKFFLQTSDNLIENETADFMSSSACASSIAQDSAKSEEELTNDVPEFTEQKDTAQNIHESSENEARVEQKESGHEKGPANPNTGGENPVTGGHGTETEGTDKQDAALQVLLENATVQEGQNFVEDSYLELLYSNYAEHSVIIDASYTVQQRNEEGQYVTLPLATLQSSPTEALHLAPGESGMQIVELWWYAEKAGGMLEPGWYRMVKTIDDRNLCIEFFLEATIS